MMVFTPNESDADIIIRKKDVSLLEVMAIAIFSKVKNARIYEDGFDVNHGAVLVRTFNEETKALQSNRAMCFSVSDVWDAIGKVVVSQCENSYYVFDIVKREFIDLLDSSKKNEECITFNYFIEAMLELSSPSLIKAVNVAEILLEKAINDAVLKAESFMVVDEAIKFSEGKVMVLYRTVPYLMEAILNTRFDMSGIEFVVFPCKKGYKFSGIPVKNYETGEIGLLKLVPLDWCILPVEEIRDFLGIPGIISINYYGFGGVCETMEEAIYIANLI